MSTRPRSWQRATRSRSPGRSMQYSLITRLGTLTRPTLQELGRVLRRSPAPVLGIVVTGRRSTRATRCTPWTSTRAERVPGAPPAAARLEEVAPEARSASGGLEALDASSRRLTPRAGVDYGPPRTGYARASVFTDGDSG